MSKLALALTLALAAMPSLSGCQAATPTVTLPSRETAAPAAAPGLSLKAPRLLGAAQVRRVLQAASDGLTIFGVNYNASYRRYDGKKTRTETWTVSAPFTGRGTFTKASHDRFVYEVPADQMLIINQTQGQGRIALNGYAFRTGEGSVAYMFGPGELVVFTFLPDQTYASSRGDTVTKSFSAIGISGYVGSPELIGRVLGSSK
jgi:hypothetical protein